MGLHWRNLKNDSADGKGKISEAWNVRAYPTMYLVDHRGVIRSKWVISTPSSKNLDKLLDELIQEAREANADRARMDK